MSDCSKNRFVTTIQIKYNPRDKLIKDKSHSSPHSDMDATQDEEPVQQNVETNVCVFLMNQRPLCVQFSHPQQAVTSQEIQNLVYNQLNTIYYDNDDSKKLSFTPKHKNIFTLWVTSQSLELQLKTLHRPFNILAKWDTLLSKYGSSDASQNSQFDHKDDPILSYQRNVFTDKREEMKIEPEDIGALRLLYEEAKINILDGRYPVGSNSDYEKLAAAQAFLEFGPFDAKTHTSEFLRNGLQNFVPSHYFKRSASGKKNGLFRSLSGGNKSNCVTRVLQKYEEISRDQPTDYKVLRTYMEFCWSLPFYGSAFFSGQIEKPVKGLASLFNHFDTAVWIAINREGVHVISKEFPDLLLSVGYDQLCWEIGCPKDANNPDCLPCLFIQMKDNSEGNRILQIFSRQVKLIDTLLGSFVEEMLVSSNFYERNEAGSGDFTDGPPDSNRKKMSLSDTFISCKMNKLSFATFDKVGNCTNKRGSWLYKN